MSDRYRGLDDLSVNPFIEARKLYVKADFKCPICGEKISMQFTEEDLKQLLKKYQELYQRGPP